MRGLPCLDASLQTVRAESGVVALAAAPELHGWPSKIHGSHVDRLLCLDANLQTVRAVSGVVALAAAPELHGVGTGV